MTEVKKAKRPKRPRTHVDDCRHLLTSEHNISTNKATHRVIQKGNVNLSRVGRVYCDEVHNLYVVKKNYDGFEMDGFTYNFLVTCLQ